MELDNKKEILIRRNKIIAYDDKHCKIKYGGKSMPRNKHIYLFRTKFVKGKQLPLSFHSITPEEILKTSINEKPALEVREGYTWHIGNVHFINDTMGHFKIGRRSLSDLPKYDDQTKDFINELSETSPNTIVYFDASYGLLGLVNNYELSPTEFGLANKLQQLLQGTNIVVETMTNVEIDSVKNPVEFITRVRNAYSIKKFSVTFSGPNPFDADEYFHKPMSIYLNEANGKVGKTIIDGDDLKSSVIIDMTKSIASTGNDATARIQEKSHEKVVTIYLKKNAAKVILPMDEESDEIIISKMLEVYHGVRD